MSPTISGGEASPSVASISQAILFRRTSDALDEEKPMVISQQLPAIDFATLELLPYGIIVLDGDGTVLHYNAREEQIAERSREDVLGRNFFTEIAPCTQVEQFHGQFVEIMRNEGSTAEFKFHFPFPGRRSRCPST